MKNKIVKIKFEVTNFSENNEIEILFQSTKFKGKKIILSKIDFEERIFEVEVLDKELEKDPLIYEYAHTILMNLVETAIRIVDEKESEKNNVAL